MGEANMENLEQRTNGGRKYYPVTFINGREVILGLPEGENPKDYIVHLASGEQLKEVGTSHVAEKRSPEVSREAEDWDDQGGEMM